VLWQDGKVSDAVPSSDAESPVRRALVDAAITLLESDGPEALKVRKVAAAVGMSTMALYTHVGGLGGLVEAVGEEGFRRLSGRLAEVGGSDDPVADVLRLGLAYRAFVQESPHLYALMFGQVAPGGYVVPAVDVTAASSPSPAGEETFARLVDVAARALAAGRFEPADARVVAAQLWIQLHGFVTLEARGYFGAPERSLAEVLGPATLNLLVGLGDTRPRAVASLARVAGG
jgi:AcrR family transcriptional regulator